MEPEGDQRDNAKPTRNLLYEITLALTALVGVIYVTFAIANGSSWTMGLIYLVVCPVIVLAVQGKGWVVLLLGLFAVLSADALTSRLYPDTIVNLGLSNATLFWGSVLVCLLQLALTLQLLERRRTENTDWPVAASYGLTIAAVSFLAFMVIGRPHTEPEWESNVRIAVIIGLFQSGYMRYWAAPATAALWRNNMQILRKVFRRTHPPTS